MFENNENKYADIINLPRPASKRKPMSMHDRVGYETFNKDKTETKMII